MKTEMARTEGTMSLIPCFFINTVSDPSCVPQNKEKEDKRQAAFLLNPQIYICSGLFCFYSIHHKLDQYGNTCLQGRWEIQSVL